MAAQQLSTFVWFQNTRNEEFCSELIFLLVQRFGIFEPEEEKGELRQGIAAAATVLFTTFFLSKLFLLLLPAVFLIF